MFKYFSRNTLNLVVQNVSGVMLLVNLLTLGMSTAFTFTAFVLLLTGRTVLSILQMKNDYNMF